MIMVYSPLPSPEINRPCHGRDVVMGEEGEYGMVSYFYGGKVKSVQGHYRARVGDDWILSRINKMYVREKVVLRRERE